VGVLLLLYFDYIGISLYMKFLALLPATLRMAHKNHLRDPGLSPVEPLRGGAHLYAVEVEEDEEDGV